MCQQRRSPFIATLPPGYVNNVDEKSYAAWLKECNNTVGAWLTNAGYHTAFLGKYVNGMESHPVSQIAI